MPKLEKVLYTARAHTTGGRDGGTSRTDDGRLEVTLTEPGKPGNGTNPEQLLAAGWSACYLSAVLITAAKQRVALPAPPAIDVEVDLGVSGGSYGLGARIDVSLPGLDHDTAQSIADAASRICPYSTSLKDTVQAVYTVTTTARVEHAAAAQPA